MPASVGSPRPQSRPVSTVGSPAGATAQLSPSQASPRSPLQNMQNMSISVKPPGPSGPGKAGHNLEVLTNHFLMNVSDFPDLIYKWNADVRSATNSSKAVAGRVKRRVFELLLQNHDVFSHGVYSDFVASLWSFKRLTDGPCASRTVSVDYYEPEEPGPRTGGDRALYYVQISLAFAPLPSDPIKALLSKPGSGTIIQRPVIDYEEALNNIVLRYAALNPNLETHARGSKIFSRNPSYPATEAPPRRHGLTGGLTADRGYIRRAKITQGGIHLALMTTASVMYEETDANTLIKNWRSAHPGASKSDQDDFVRRVRVRSGWGVKRVKPIWKVHPQDTHTATFRCESHPRTDAPLDKDVTVAWYFEQAYNIKLMRATVVDVGNLERSCLWPADLCRVLPAQSYKGVLLPKQAQEMIKSACRRPEQNAKLITTEGQDMVGINRANASAGTICETPIKALLHLATVTARFIGSPTLIFGKSTLSGREAARGQWNLQGRHFLQPPAEPAKFTVLVLRGVKEPGISNREAFEAGLSDGARRYCGITQTSTKVPDVGSSLIWPQKNQVAWLKSLFTHCFKSGVKYCFIVASDKTWYAAIKEGADSAGMQTTVTLRQPGNTARASPGEIANLMLKYSMKTLGINWTLALPDFNHLLKKRSMLFGLDVVHPPPGARKGGPSVGGLVYSVNPSPGQFLPYVFIMTPQVGKASQEVVPQAYLRPGIEYALRGWQKRQGQLPEILFMCRDGVSDTQLEQVLNEELPAMMNAARNVYGNQQLPELFILNTQKRHVTRFFKSKDDKAADKLRAFDDKGNPMPGLIVDTNIVSRTRDDWYSVSHKCLQGTTRPAHHVRLYDELNLPKDQLQQLVHNLSFIYPRSVTSVSIPTPAKLADRLCERAKTRLHDVYFPSEEDRFRPWSVHEGGFLGQQSVHPDIRDTMYYI